MMKTLSLLLSLLATQLYAQTVLNGKVTDKQGEPVPLANVVVLNTYDGGSCDADGNFQFTTTETGEQVIAVSFMGFKTFQQKVALTGQKIFLTIVLEEAISELKAVTISAGSFTASDESRRTVFRAIDIATTAGATADIAGALNTLPGTQKVGESGRLFVRGGDGSEARTFIDGMLVLDAYSPSAPNTPSRGRFLPFMFKGSSFSTGGYSSEYGQALSSVLVLDSKDESELTRTDIGILSVGGDVAHTQAWERGSVAGKIQYTNIRPYFGLINQEIDWKTPPASLQGTAAFRQRTGKDGMIKFFGNFNQSDLSLYNHDINDYNSKTAYDLTNKYRYVNGSYKNPLNENWMLKGGVSYTYLANDITVGSVDVRENEQGVHAKAVVQGSVSEKLEVKSGAEVFSRQYTYKAGESMRSFDEQIIAAFSEGDFYTSNSFVARAGARMEHNSLTGEVSVDPRVSLARKVGGDGQISMAYGKFRQSAKNEWLRQNTRLASEKADHYILNYQKTTNNRTFRVETYYKRYNGLVKFADPSSSTNTGTGFARGFEFFWRDNESLRNTDFWISYSFLDTRRNYLNYPVTAVPVFASAHNFSAVYKYFITDLKSQLGATYAFASGRAYNNPNSGSFNSGRTPAYHDLSMNVSYLPKPFLIIHLSCTNVLGRDNIFGYEYSDKLNEDGVYNHRATRLPAKRFLFIGIFITLSREKSVNQLPAL
jgi:hypothetical protein